MNSNMLLRLNYARVIGLLCDLSIQVDEESRKSIDAALGDFCDLTGWSYTRVLNTFEVTPPAPAPGVGV